MIKYSLLLIFLFCSCSTNVSRRIPDDLSHRDDLKQFNGKWKSTYKGLDQYIYELERIIYTAMTL